MQAKLIPFIALLTMVLSVSAFGLESKDLGSAGRLNQSELPEVSQSLQEFVDSALIYAKENGKERALEEFNSESGQFVLGDGSYIFAYGFDGTYLANPFRPEMMGEDQIDYRDTNGLLIIRNMNNIASRGKGFAYYVRSNPQHNETPELRLIYIAKVDNDWWLGTGMFLSDTPAIFSSESRLALVNFVDRAVIYAQENGKEKALEAFNDVNGDFVDGDCYIYALDFNGTVLAHPIQPERVGKNKSEELEFYGALYIRDLMDVAMAGTGLLYYTYPEPENNMIPALKLSYVRKVDDEWWLGSDIYIKEADQAKDSASLSYGPPTSKEGLVAFVESASSYARVYGKDIATRDFMDLDGPFVREELYVFAYEFDGTCLSLPHLPSWVGTYLLDLQDPEGVYIIEEMSSIALNGSGFFEYVWTNPVTNETEPKMSYVTKVDDDWWLGAGIYLNDGKATAT